MTVYCSKVSQTFCVLQIIDFFACSYLYTPSSWKLDFFLNKYYTSCTIFRKSQTLEYSIEMTQYALKTEKVPFLSFFTQNFSKHPFSDLFSFHARVEHITRIRKKMFGVFAALLKIRTYFSIPIRNHGYVDKLVLGTY